MTKVNFHPQGQFYEGLIQNATGAQATGQPQQAQGGQKFYMTFTVLDKNQEVLSDCAQITFLNLGTAIVFLNGVPLPQFWYFTSPAEWNETDTTQYLLQFDNSAAGSKNCLVIRKNRTA